MDRLERSGNGYGKWAYGALLMLLPVFLFYRALIRYRVDIPNQDDYGAILGFLSAYKPLGFIDRLIYCLSAQHGEYKLIFQHFVFAAIYGVTGRANFSLLVILSSIFVFFIFLLLLRMSTRSWQEIPSRLLLLAPCAYLLFQLQYASALSWAMASWQILPAIFFSLLSVHLLCDDSPKSFGGACLSLFLAIASSANGFFLFPVGLFILGLNKRFARMAYWCVVFGTTAALYFWRYDFNVSQTHQGESVVSAGSRLHLLYTLSFLGSSGAKTESYQVSAALGLLLCGLFLYACWKKYYRVNINIFSAMLLLVVTGVCVGILRGDLGIAQSLASRYRIYSNLFLVLAYIFLAHRISSSTISQAWKKVGFCAALLFVAVFALLSDRAGQKFLESRRTELIYGLLLWQDPAFTPPQAAGGEELSKVMERHRESNLFRPEGPVLQRAMQLGIYFPPLCTADGVCRTNPAK